MLSSTKNGHSVLRQEDCLSSSMYQPVNANVRCGAFSSLHDRAAEIFYALKGGRCDYGAEHAAEHTHARFGVDYGEGLYPLWSAEHPIAILGHSLGGVTAFQLQHRLGKELPGHPSWIRSIASISSPHRGTPLGEALGQFHGGQKTWSISWLGALSVHIGRTLQLIGSEIYDLGGKHWLEDDTHTTKYGIVDAICDYCTGRAEGFNADCAGHDMLMSSAESFNADTTLHPTTFYRSFAASTSKPTYIPPLAYSWQKIHDFPDLDPEWVESDGLVPLISQYHPKDCTSTQCLHFPESLTFNNEPPPIPGIWHVRYYSETTHFGLCNYLWRLGIAPKTRQFWLDYGDWLRKIDTVSTTVPDDSLVVSRNATMVRVV